MQPQFQSQFGQAAFMQQIPVNNFNQQELYMQQNQNYAAGQNQFYDAEPQLPSTSKSKSPALILCKNCNEKGITNIKKTTSQMAHVACCLLCLAGCNLGCCFIPYCLDDLKVTKHFCSSCGNQAGQSF